MTISKKQKPPRIRWRACGENQLDRRGSIPGLEVSITFSWMRSTSESERYTVHCYMKDRGKFGDIEEAKAFAQEHVAEWFEEKLADHKDREAEKTRKADEHAAAVARLDDLRARLQGVGVETLDSYFGALVISYDQAEELIRRLN